MPLQASLMDGNAGAGLKAGLNFARFTGEDSQGAETRTAFMVGGFLNLAFDEYVSLRPEVYYSQKGTDISDDSLSGSYELNYIEIPVLLVYNIPTKATGIAPYIFTGPSVGINLSATIEGAINGQTRSADIDNPRPVDLGIAFGGGMGFPIGQSSSRIMIELRYTLGLTKAFEDVSNPGPADLVVADGEAPEIKNGSLSLLVGFGLGE